MMNYVELINIKNKFINIKKKQSRLFYLQPVSCFILGIPSTLPAWSTFTRSHGDDADADRCHQDGISGMVNHGKPM